MLLIVAPLLIPLCAAALTALLRTHIAAQRVVGVSASASLLAVGLMLVARTADGSILVTQMGDWAAPFGIALVVDAFSAIMLAIAGLMALSVSIYAMGPDAAARDRAGFQPLFHSLMLGVCGAFVAGDVFNLYVWFEVMLIASFGLLVLDRTRAQIDGGLRYVFLNLVGTTVFLMAVGLLYGQLGTLNFADLARLAPQAENQGLLAAIGVMFLVSFGAKAALFPLFNWLPAAYHTASMPVAAIFAGLLTKVGVYAILRLFALVYAHDVAFFGPIFAWVAAATMVFGVFGAAAHYDIRRILSFHIVSQIGYMIIGVALLTQAAIAAAILYIVHHIVVKANLFLVAGAIRRENGSYALGRCGGLWRAAPLLAIGFLIPALSLAGIPPLSGFWGKYAVVRAGIEAEAYWLAGIALFVGLLTLYSMIKIWNEAFWKPAPEGLARTAWTRGQRIATYLPIALLCATTMTIGLWTEPFAALAETAAASLLDRDAYIAAVLGNAGQVAEFAR
jgi:multicomponent Na+:H+ antiporter subunit D